MSEVDIGNEGGSGGVQLGQIVELNPAFPAVYDAPNGQRFVKNGFAISSGYDPALEDYKNIITGFRKVSIGIAPKDFDVSNGVIIGACAEGKVIRSEDDGATWQTIQTPINTVLNCIKGFGDVWIAGGESNLLVRSTDAGKTWVALAGFGASYFIDIETDGINWVLITSFSGNNVWRSNDAGQTWVKGPENLFAGYSPKAIAYGDGTFAIVGQNVVAYSYDGGENWNTKTVTGSLSNIIASDNVFIVGAGTSNQNFWCNSDMAVFTSIPSFNVAMGHKYTVGCGEFVYTIDNQQFLLKSKISQIIGGFSSALAGRINPEPGQIINAVASGGRKVFLMYSSFFYISKNAVGLDMPTTDKDMDRFFMRVL